MQTLADLVVVIPTLNEEHYIGTLLDSIIAQSILPKEIVIVDAYSKDKTIKEIKKRQVFLPQLKVYRIPKYTIGRQRNFGVKKTKSQHIIFLDADMKLQEKDTLKLYMDEIKKKKPDIAVAENFPLSKDARDLLYFKILHLVSLSIKPFWPAATSMNLYVKRSSFKKVLGFDDKVRIWEDSNLIQRIVENNGKFLFLKKPKLYTSIRRLKKEGRIRMNLKSLQAFLQILTLGYHDIKVKYEFGNHKN